MRTIRIRYSQKKYGSDLDEGRYVLQLMASQHGDHPSANSCGVNNYMTDSGPIYGFVWMKS